jgi:gamma-glutamylcyclotransferase (GGCT)/AIG2-like uncharacterized protein YtfP
MSILYFAYGSNLNLKDLREYEKRNGINAKKSFVDSINISDGIFFLPDYQLQFPVYSKGREGGVLDVTTNVGHVVAGKLFEVDNWNLLDMKEGSPNFYKRIAITVIDENGKTFDAFTYVVNSKNKKEYEKPNQNYVKIVSEGYEEFGISEKFPWAYENLISASENKKCKMVDSMFVYGTLRKQECREKIMNEISLDSKNITIKAKMYDIGAFPAITLEEGIVYGEIHKIKEEPNSFETLDCVEGFTEYDKSSLYHRILINSSQGICWTYVWNDSTENYKIIQNGNWRTRK